MLITDRDLLVYEPDLFNEVAWSAQRVVRCQGSISGSEVTLVDPHDSLSKLGIHPGMVVTGGGTAAEVLAVDGSSLTVSRPRVSASDPPVAPVPFEPGVVVCATFDPQIALAQGVVERMLGFETAIDPAAVMTPAPLTRLVALFTLHLIYSSAAAAVPDSQLLRKAAMYRDRFGAEKGRAEIVFDLDGDGAADSRRRPGVLSLIRA